MSYEISYTDSVNKGTITLSDNTLNSETSLSLPGRFTTAYGQAISENFLHLLENFASSTAPQRPVEGQLWYDTATGVDQLKLYDGTVWQAAAGLKKASSEPAVANSSAGDLWVNTGSQQLYLFTGSTWVLVGPEFTDGLLTGTKSDVLVGTDNLSYSVLSVKVKDKTAFIISDREFIPKTAIAGFTTGIKAGMNVSSAALFGSETLKYYGTSEKADALVIGSKVVPAANFIRTDETSISNFDLKLKNNDGLIIGTGGQLALQVDGEQGVIQHNTSGSNIDFRLRNGPTTTTVLRIDATGKMGVNNSAPEQELDVSGNIKVSPRTGVAGSGYIDVTSTIDSTSISTGSIKSTGGLGVALNAYIGGTVDVAGDLITTDVEPDTASTRNIGTLVNKYDAIYANTFYGNIQGNVSGTVSGRAGSADKLASATTFAVTGDVTASSFEFDGQTGGSTKTFSMSIANTFISNKNVTYTAENSDEVLLNRPTGSTGVFRITKANLLKSVPLTPIGTMSMFGGSTAPLGWLFCDGSEIRKSDYNDLWLQIGFNFKDSSLISDSGVNFFALPDMRGRFALGLDAMGGSSANRVTDVAADSIGGTGGTQNTSLQLENLPEHEHDMEGDSGTQYYATRVGTGTPTDTGAIQLSITSGTQGTHGLASSGGIKTTSTLGTPMNTIDPYLAINYIMYTGVTT
jgi:microcystin-dependent protein